MWSTDLLAFAHRWRKSWRRLPTKQYQRRSARRVSRGKLTGLLAPRCPSICLLENVVLAKQIVDNVFLVLNVFLFALWVIILYLLALHIPLPYFKEEIWLWGHGDFVSWIFKNESHILVKVRFERGFNCFFHSAEFAVVRPIMSSLSLSPPPMVHAGTEHWPARACMGCKCSMQLCHSSHQPLILGDSSRLCSASYEPELYVPEQPEISMKIVAVITFKYVISLHWSTTNEETHISCSQHNFSMFHKTMKMTFFDYMYEVNLKSILMNTARQVEICRHHWLVYDDVGIS